MTKLSKKTNCKNTKKLAFSKIKIRKTSNMIPKKTMPHIATAICGTRKRVITQL